MSSDEKTTETQKPSLFRRAGRTTLRVGLTLGVAGIAVLAVQLGSQELTQRAEAAPAPDAAPIMPVQTSPIVLAPGYEVTRAFVGQIEARRTAVVSFELSGRLDAIIVEEGDKVAKGQHIATLDTRLLDAERERLSASKTALEAQLRFAQQTVERQSRLNDQGFASRAALDEALSRSDELTARIAEVEAALMTTAIQVEKSKIFAPFTGRVTERRVDGGESVAPGQIIIEVVEAGAPYLRVGLPLDVSEDDLSDATVEIAGVEYASTLLALRPDIDPATRTRTAIFELNADADLAFGQTARLRLSDTINTEGLWVPMTTLKEGLRGQWTLLGVDAEDVVRALSVQVLHTDGDQVFVRGAFPPDTQLITTGPQRITVGQTVDPKPAT